LLGAGLGASSCRLMSAGRGSASAHVGSHHPAGLRSYPIDRKCVRLIAKAPVSVRRAQAVALTASAAMVMTTGAPKLDHPEAAWSARSCRKQWLTGRCIYARKRIAMHG